MCDTARDIREQQINARLDEIMEMDKMTPEIADEGCALLHELSQLAISAAQPPAPQARLSRFRQLCYELRGIIWGEALLLSLMTFFSRQAGSETPRSWAWTCF